MNILSISHKVAPILIREQFTLSQESQDEFLLSIIDNSNISECVYLSTCNRTEIYFEGNSDSIEEMEKLLISFTNVDINIKKYFLIYQGQNAIKHLYSVASGLDSMLIGEDEILGQLKDAFSNSLRLGTTKYHLNTLFKGAITCAKNIKTNTNMSRIPLSIGTLVTNMITENKHKNLNVLIIGVTGKMGTTILKNLYNKENISIVGTTRSHNTFFEYKNKYNLIEMIEYKDRYNYINAADVVISATRSPHYTITANEVILNIKDNKERIFIDLSVPKDIDADLLNYKNNLIYNIDYFKSIATVNNNTRIKEVEIANSIIAEHIDVVKKELYFHDFLGEIGEIKKIFNENTFENIIYKIRDTSNSNEFKSVIDAFRKL